jgi:hypothetical protein
MKYSEFLSEHNIVEGLFPNSGFSKTFAFSLKNALDDANIKEVSFEKTTKNNLRGYTDVFYKGKKVFTMDNDKDSVDTIINKIKKSLNISEEVNNQNFTNFKAFMKKQGFTSWEFEDDYETLIITFANGQDAAKALKASMSSNNEISAYGEVEQSGKTITVSLNKSAQAAISANESANKEDFIQESKTISGVFVVDGDSKEQPAKITVGFSTLTSQKNGMLKIVAGGKNYELHFDTTKILQ